MIAPGEPIGGGGGLKFDSSNQFQVLRHNPGNPFAVTFTVKGFMPGLGSAHGTSGFKTHLALEKHAALRLAGWLAAMADPEQKLFPQMLAEITKGMHS